MSGKLSAIAIADIRTKRMSLREYAKLYNVHHTSVLRIQNKRSTNGHNAKYYVAYYPKRGDEYPTQRAETRMRRYWVLWLLRELNSEWGLSTDLVGVSTWGIDRVESRREYDVAVARARQARKDARRAQQVGGSVRPASDSAAACRGGRVVRLRGDQIETGGPHVSDDRLLPYAGYRRAGSA